MWCPRRTKRKGTRPGMTGDGIEDEKWTLWRVPDNKGERKRILGRVMAIAVMKVFSSNVYTFAGEICLQAHGSPIGLDLSGEVARVEMRVCDAKMRELCEKNGVEADMSYRYVDDVNTILGAIPHGYRCTGERLEYDPSWELEDEAKPLNKHTVTIIVAMSNSIRDSIQMEGDCCTNHQSGYIPVLDLKMNTVLIYQPANPEENTPEVMYHQVCSKFFKKPMARRP